MPESPYPPAMVETVQTGLESQRPPERLQVHVVKRWPSGAQRSDRRLYARPVRERIRPETEPAPIKQIRGQLRPHLI
jgi:hypothetical protein